MYLKYRFITILRKYCDKLPVHYIFSVPITQGKHDIFGADMKDSDTAGQSLYFVRALSYCDINKIELDDLKEVLQTYPEFAEQFIRKFHVTFDLKKVFKFMGLS